MIYLEQDDPLILSQHGADAGVAGVNGDATLDLLQGCHNNINRLYFHNYISITWYFPKPKIVVQPKCPAYNLDLKEKFRTALNATKIYEYNFC